MGAMEVDVISIVNVGPHTADPGGERNYELRINNELICTFKHKRANGLAVCLMEAARAAEKKKWEGFEKLLSMGSQMNGGAW